MSGDKIAVEPDGGTGEQIDMATTEQDLQSFTDFAQQRLSSGENLNLDELFDLWRIENPSAHLHAENVDAINFAIRDLKNGDRGTPAGEHSDHLRREFNIESQ